MRALVKASAAMCKAPYAACNSQLKAFAVEILGKRTGRLVVPCSAASGRGRAKFLPYETTAVLKQ